IHAIDLYRTLGYVIETRQQVDDRGLAGTRGTDDSESLARLCSKGNTFQYRYTIFVFMCDIIEFNKTFDLGQWFCTRFIGHGRVFIENAEDTFAARYRVLDVRPEHCDLL